MIDVPWKIFSQTGNIEAYLWMKEVESDVYQEPEDENDHTLFEDTHF
ncbi:YqzL family protein [Gracilibacillus salinarum]|uniref:YqzL family protein n=2 Tax=Gracilibacillus TaxID=74385 RepID=A0ABY4GT15_9BACI|nr:MULTISPECIES: YqzL family protein [Gracilibacillus]UOQ47418.1 YqzL family protein [Gracilibacillus caseinilyticus]UOQ87414.1 YqzL family protein [Gracilibacillus salinarum]